MLALLQDIKDPENLKTLKIMMGNRSMNDVAMIKLILKRHASVCSPGGIVGARLCR